MIKEYYLEGNPIRIWLVLAAMCFAVFTVAFNTTAVMNALIVINDELKFTPASLQWVVNAYLLTCASFIIIAGQLADMLGRRRLFFVGTTLFIIASIGIALSHNATLLIVFRAMQGLSAAIVTPCSLAVIKVGFPEKLQSTAIGIWTGTIGLGFAFGPIISGLFTSYLTWRAIFWTNIPIMLIAIIIARLFARRTRGARENIRLDLWGLFLLLFGLVPLTLALVEGNTWGWSSLATLTLLIGGGFILALFWFIERYIQSPLVHFHHFRERIFVAGNIGIAASIFTLMGILYFFNAFIQNPLLMHLSPMRAGLAILPTSLSMFVLSVISAKITTRFGFRFPMAIGLIFIAIAALWLRRLTLESTYASMWFPLMLWGVGMGVSFSSSPALGMSALSKEKAGEGSGIINTINYYSGVLCICLGTLISITIGREHFYQALLSVRLPNVDLSKIDNAMFGHQGSLQLLIQQAPSDAQQPLLHAVQLATLHSFTAVMTLCFLVAVVGTVGILLFAGKKK